MIMALLNCMSDKIFYNKLHVYDTCSWRSGISVNSKLPERVRAYLLLQVLNWGQGKHHPPFHNISQNLVPPPMHIHPAFLQHISSLQSISFCDGIPRPQVFICHLAAGTSDDRSVSRCAAVVSCRQAYIENKERQPSASYFKPLMVGATHRRSPPVGSCRPQRPRCCTSPAPGRY